MTTTTPVPLPPGALAGSTFEEWDNEFRTLYSQHRSVAGPISVVTVYASAIQRPDGMIEGTSAGVGDAPRVWCDFEGGGDGMVTSQARELAAALLAAADVADRWADESVDPVDALATARQALQAAYQATRLLPGNSGDYVRAALDSIDDAIEVTR